MHKTLVLVVLLVALTACGSKSDAAFTGHVLPRPFTVPATALTDTQGASYSLASDTHQRLTLVYFGYTHCPDICGVVMSTLASAMTRLDDADRTQVGVVFVTSDPARDNATVLRDYLDHYDPTFEGLTGRLDVIAKVGLGLGVPVGKGHKLPSGGYDVTHGTNIIGVDGKGAAPIVWDQDTSSAQYAADIHQLLSH